MNRVCFKGLLAAILVSQLFNVNISSAPVPPEKPSCWVDAWPPRMLLLSQLPRSSGNDEVIYKALYCYSNPSSEYCLKPAKVGYKTLNCTVTSTDGQSLSCNMTKLILKLYPNLVDLSQKSQLLGYRLYMVFSATYNNETTYSKFKYCNVNIPTKLKPIEDLQAKLSVKRQVTLSWKSPYDKSINGFLKYIFSISSEVDNFATTKNINVDPSNPTSFYHSHIFKDLRPFTRYKMSGSVFVTKSYAAVPSKIVEFRTLPEAPSSPPIIIDASLFGKNSTGKTVRIEWQHPLEKERRGNISKTVIEYQKSVDHINLTLPSYVNLSISGYQTMTLITGLDPYARYALTLRSCTVAGCSNRSRVYIIKGLPPKIQPSKQGSEINQLVLIPSLVVVSIILGIVFTICFACWLKRHPRSNNNREQPPPLDDITIVCGNDSSDNDASFSGKENEYAVYSTNHSDAAILVNNVSDQGTDSRRSSEDIPLC